MTNAINRASPMRLRRSRQDAGSPPPVVVHEQVCGMGGCASFWSLSQPEEPAASLHANHETRQFSLMSAIQSIFCGGETGITYEQALAQSSAPRNVEAWYESVAAVNALDSGCSRVISPSQMHHYNEDIDEVEEDVEIHHFRISPDVSTAMLEDAVQQLKAEVAKLEMKKKKKVGRANRDASEKENVGLQKQQVGKKLRDVIIETTTSPLKQLA